MGKGGRGGFYWKGRKEEERGQKFSVICHSSLLNYFQFQNVKNNFSSLLYNIVTQ